MKNKSTKHKEENTFKFQPFSERINNVDINVFHRVGHEYENQTDADVCYFQQTIQKWNVLNLTQSYGQFKKDVKSFTIITLPQLVHNKELIIETLTKYLQEKNILSLQPLLELVVALAQDLRTEFYEHFQGFLSILIDLLNTKNVEQLEWTFTCLAYLFKFLWRTLIKNINSIFDTLLPLLSDDKPEYINNFAAESFAFVARKVKDRKSFLLLIIKTVKHNKDGISGCGRLLFEVIHGVKSSFHSCANQWLETYLELLSEDNVTNVWYEILEQVVGNIVANIHHQSSDVFWTTFIKATDKLLENRDNKKSVENLNFVLQCIGQAIEHKGGVFLKNIPPVIQQLIKIIDTLKTNNEILMISTKIIIILLLSRNLRLQQEQASTVVRAILNLSNKDILLYFVENVLNCSLFEALILPSFLKFCVDTELDSETLHVLTKLILKKSPLNLNGINLENWVKYNLHFNSKHDQVKIEKILTQHLVIETTKPEDYICAVICLPHIAVSNKDIGRVLLENIVVLCDRIRKEENIGRNLFLISISLDCLIHTTEDVQVIAMLMDCFIDVILPLSNNVMYISAIQVLDLFLSALKGDSVNKELLLKLHHVLEDNFSSPYHEIRLYTTHIYSLFDGIFKFEDSIEDWNVFTLCYKVESIQPLVHTYREQLLYLEKLTFDKPQITMCNQTEFKAVPLRYLCGVLYVNFKLLWEPVLEIIASYATGMDIAVFWEVFVKELKRAADNVKSKPEVSAIDIDLCEDFLCELYRNTYQIASKADFANYRLLLWKGLSLFPAVGEAKTRDISELLLNFFEVEYMRSNTEIAATWNIKQNEIEETIPDTTIDELDEDADIKKALKVSTPSSGGKSNVKALLQHLTVFSKVRSPKSMYREPELYKLYFDLLSHKNPDVQKAALDCVMTYKFKYLTPYSENLYKLIDDKNFKHELVMFRVDQESSVIQKEHRKDLIPVVMKLVFSKMMVKTGLRTGGKSGGGQMRRNLIFRFLAGCEEEEMISFINMTFKFYNSYLLDDPLEMTERSEGSVVLEKFIPPKRLQSTLNMINVILEQFGGLMEKKLLNYLLRIVLFIGSLLKGAQNQHAQIHAGYFSILRNLRTSALKIITKFFELFETYTWTAKEINAIFNVFIWPYLNKLNIEGIHSPTALLKLFICWGNNPRYFSLLVKHQKDNPSEFALPYIMQLLTNEKTQSSVSTSIMEMVEKLLTLQPNEEDIKNVIPVEDRVPIKNDLVEKLKVDENLNYGSCILLPHVISILSKIKRRLESKAKNINRRELFILSRISELVTDSDISDRLLQLLLPIVLKKSSRGINEEILVQMMTTLNNLVLNVTEPEKHLKQISPLFCEIIDPAARKILCRILTNIATVTEKYKSMSDVINSLNAWDAKWVDQPDFQKRTDTFKQVTKMISESTIDVELGILLIYNSFYCLKSEKDLSLKENASHCLKTLCPHLVQSSLRQTDRTYIIDETLFNLIRDGFKSKYDDYRNECISLLGYLARECPESHNVLRDLHKLTNKQDLEVDFFENITHLQVHRHGRALLKFSTIFKQEETAPSIRTLTQFILPLATHYLCNEKHTGKNSLIDATLETVGTICRLLPWQQYEGLLKYYLAKLRKNIEFQKQLVRLLVIILDAFHFDLNKAHIEVAQITEAIIQQQNEISQENIVPKDEGEEKEKNSDETIVNDDNEEDKDEEEEEPAIDDVLNDDVQEDDEEVKDDVKVTKPYEKVIVLCRSAAIRVVNTIQNILLPQLHKALAVLTQHETSHKLNRKKTCMEKEEEDLLRVPISLALVKLLQKLPKEILDANISGVLTKLCTFLKSQLESVRRAARESLQNIITSLGPDYLKLLFDEMVPLLSRGFQVHVLVYTVHAILACMKDMFKAGDVDKVLVTVLKLCKTDLFGVLSEEKEVMKIVSKVSEAKSSKSMDTFQILAQFITEDSLLKLIDPLKQILSSSHSFKLVNKAQEAFKHIALGLINNQFISVDVLLKFSYNIITDSIAELKAIENPPAISEEEVQKAKRRKIDCFIIPKEPVYRSGRRTSSSKVSNKTNTHVIAEFGLKICYFLLKRDLLKSDCYNETLDMFVPKLRDTLESKNMKLCTVTLQCLPWILKCNLPSLKSHIDAMTEIIFKILHKYGAAGLSKGDNFDLVVASFKAVTVLVRDVKFHTIKPEQLSVLLLYIEQDLHNYERQATAFGLLKALLTRKLTSPEIYDIMKKVMELSITSELPHIRAQSRVVAHQFLLDYPLGKKLDTHVSFYLSQLKYELQTGRESAIEMLQGLITSFPMGVLKSFSGTFFVTMGARLVNDDQPSCRKMVAHCLTTMLNRLPRGDRDPLFDIILIWLNDEIISHRRLSSQMCGIFVEIEKALFESRLSALLPLIKMQFQWSSGQNSGRFVKIKKDDDESDDLERLNDHHMYQLLQLLLKICGNCPAFFKQLEHVDDISKWVQTLLAHPHEWVRLAASQFLGFVLTSIDTDRLAELIIEDKTDVGYLCSDPRVSVKSLTLDLCDQLQPNSIKNDLAEQVVKNLVFIARVFDKLPGNDLELNLTWLARRMRKVVFREVRETVSSTILRTEVFKWIAGVTTALSLETVLSVAHHLLAPLVREMLTVDEKDAPLRQLSKEVGGLIKKKIGMEKYAEVLGRVQQQLSVKRAERKRTKAQLAVTDPELHAKKKIKHHEKKKEAKKRKINERKGVKRKFRKKDRLELDSSEII